MATFDDVATNQQMVEIANAIRAVTRTTESITIPQMPDRLRNIKVVELSEAKVSFVSGSSVLLGKFATNISHLFIVTPKTSADADLLSQVSLEIELAFDKETGELKLNFNAPAEISDVTILVADMLLSSDTETTGFVVNSASGKIDGVTVNGEAQEVVNKIVNISVPVRTSDLLNDSDYVSDKNYIHTDNNYTTQEKQKLASLSNYDDTEVRGNIETLFTDVSTAEADIDKLESSVSTLQGTVEANTSNISDLERDLGTANSNIAQNTADIVSNSNAINEINEKIPTQASKNNQLADKDFVNSSVNNLAAFYITKNAQRDPFETHAELFSATVFYSGGQPRVPTRNDYCIVRSDEEHGNATTRYMYDVNGWAFQYIVNETPLTAAQVAAINSGITGALVQQIGENTSARHTHTNKSLLDTYSQTEANLSDAVAKKHSHSNKSILDATTASFTTEQQTKLAGVAEGANKTVIDSALSSTSTNPVQNKVVDNAIKAVTNALNGKVTAEEGKGLSSNDFTDAYKNKIDGIEAGAEVNTVDSVNGKTGEVKLNATDVGALPSDTPLFSGNYNDLSNKPTLFSGDYNDLSNKPTIPTDNNQLTNGAGYITSSGTSANATKLNGKEASYYLSYTNLTNKPSIPTTASEVGALPNTTKYGASIDLSIDDTTYVVTVQLKDQDGNNLGDAKAIDLPLESVVVSGSYDSVNKKVILTLKDGSTIDFSVADLVSGLQPALSDTQLSATNSGITSTKVQTYDAVARQYLKNASVNSTGDELTITKQDGTSVTFAGGSTPENMVTTDTEQDLSAYKDFLEGLGISDIFKLKKLTGETSQTAVDCRTIDDGIYYLPKSTYFYVNTNSVTTLGEGFVIIVTKTNNGTGKYWFYFGERSSQPTIMKGCLTSTSGDYSIIQTEGFVRTNSTRTQNISCSSSTYKSVLNLTGHSGNGTYLDFTNFENGVGKTCSIGINSNFEPSFIDKDGNEKSFGGGMKLWRYED